MPPEDKGSVADSDKPEQRKSVTGANQKDSWKAARCFVGVMVDSNAAVEFSERE